MLEWTQFSPHSELQPAALVPSTTSTLHRAAWEQPRRPNKHGVAEETRSVMNKQEM